MKLLAGLMNGKTVSINKGEVTASIPQAWITTPVRQSLGLVSLHTVDAHWAPSHVTPPRGDHPQNKSSKVPQLQTTMADSMITAHIRSLKNNSPAEMLSVRVFSD